MHLEATLIKPAPCPQSVQLLSLLHVTSLTQVLPTKFEPLKQDKHLEG